MSDNKTPPVEDIKFTETSTTKMGTLMAESTEVVDVDDVILYNNNFDTKNRTNLVPYVIYMDSNFNKVVKTKKRKDALFFLLKIFGVVGGILIILFILKVVTGN
jgi:hypothetical protein